MKQDVYIKYRDTYITRTFDIPNTCPHCGETMSPYVYQGFSQNNYNDINYEVGILGRCTIESCNKFFAIQFYKNSNGGPYFQPFKYRPPIKIDLPENISKVSSSFVEIFSQATTAEEEGLNQIAGVGYRKALEFLIKDYAISINSEKEESIKKSLLGKVIKEHLSNFPKLQSLAQAATWIGNDETHYVRRHDDKDIRDMKQFIKSASHFIVADYDADLAGKFISADD